MTELPKICAGLAVLLAFAPSAGAAGYLINVGVGNAYYAEGVNPAGGSGDFVDIGIANQQCSDEGDFVDVGIANEEGVPEGGTGGPCRDHEYACHQDQGGYYGLVGFAQQEAENSLDAASRSSGLALRPQPSSDSGSSDAYRAHCSDDGDAVDVGVDNHEGYAGTSVAPGYDASTACGAAETEYQHSARNPVYYDRYGGDYGDGVDIGVLNDERCDDHDGLDIGGLNCEASDFVDGVDVGVVNRETERDQNDDLDLSVSSSEDYDGPDHNALKTDPVGLVTGSAGIPTVTASCAPVVIILPI